MSDFRKVAYSTSQVEICKDQIISRDCDFNKEGNYVWEPKKEGYILDRIILDNDYF